MQLLIGITFDFVLRKIAKTLANRESHSHTLPTNDNGVRKFSTNVVREKSRLPQQVLFETHVSAGDKPEPSRQTHALPHIVGNATPFLRLCYRTP